MLALTAALVFVGLGAGSASAATGDLTFTECFEDNDSATEAACTDVDGLDGANRVGLSPDGRSVYVAARIDDAVVAARAHRDNEAPDGARPRDPCPGRLRP